MTELSVRPEGARFAPSGPLTFATVTEHARRLAGIPPKLPVILDLATVGECDSSALALFIEIENRVRAGGGSVEFKNVPEAVRRIAALYEIESLFSRDGIRQAAE